MSDISQLRHQLESALQGSLPLEDFVAWFEDWFSDLERNDVAEGLYIVLDDLYSGIGYFVPNEALRHDHASYFGHEELIEKLRYVREQMC